MEDGCGVVPWALLIDEVWGGLIYGHKTPSPCERAGIAMLVDTAIIRCQPEAERDR
jgi:hypothetical protein